MNLNYNSLSAKVYRLFYNTHIMPESLCPYFWKLVIAYPITLILSPLLLGTFVLTKITKDEPEDAPIAALALMGAFLYGALFIVFSIGVFISSAWITYYQKSIMFGAFLTGLCATAILGALGIFFLVRYLILERKYSKMTGENKEYESQPNIVVEFVKAKYNKYCPKINWENK